MRVGDRKQIKTNIYILEKKRMWKREGGLKREEWEERMGKWKKWLRGDEEEAGEESIEKQERGSAVGLQQ